MANGTDILTVARTKIGGKYVFGANVPKDNPNYNGPFDCAEFCAWCNYQTFGFLYGCDNDHGQPAKADAFTGYFKRDAENFGTIITVSTARATPGAMLLRIASEGICGHIVFSQGNGKTIEAHSSKDGVIENVIDGRRWDYGILLPNIAYATVSPITKTIVSPIKIWRLTNPMMIGREVGFIQRALNIKDDNIFGKQTAHAVADFQIKNALVVDGEVGMDTAKALKIVKLIYP